MSTDNTNENVSDNVLNRRQTIPRAPNNGQTSGVHMRLVDDSDVRGNKRKATNAADAAALELEAVKQFPQKSNTCSWTWPRQENGTRSRRSLRTSPRS